MHYVCKAVVKSVSFFISTFPLLSQVEVSQYLYEQEASGSSKWWICSQNGSFSALMTYQAQHPDPIFHRNVNLLLTSKYHFSAIFIG